MQTYNKWFKCKFKWWDFQRTWVFFLCRMGLPSLMFSLRGVRLERRTWRWPGGNWGTLWGLRWWPVPPKHSAYLVGTVRRLALFHVCNGFIYISYVKMSLILLMTFCIMYSMDCIFILLDFLCCCFSCTK